jgi:AraC-like ligand binding domain
MSEPIDASMGHHGEGEHIYQCGDEEFQVAPGGLVFLPRGIPHARRRVVPQAGRLIFMTFPGGFEWFFRILAEASQSGDLGEAAYARASRIASTFPDLGLSAGRVSGCRSMLAARVADDLPH